MKAMKCFTADGNAFNVQKCYFSSNYYGKLCFLLRPGCYIEIISPLQNVKCICKVYYKSNLPLHVCVLDASVISYCEILSSDTDFVPISHDYVSYFNHFQLDSVRIIPQVLPIKSLEISVVFQEIEYVSYWQYDKQFSDVLKDILKLFVISCNSKIYLNKLKLAERLGIYCIIVHSIHCETAFGKTVSKTKVFTRDYVSRMRYEQLHRTFNIVPLGGLDAPLNILSDMVYLIKNLNLNCRKDMLVAHISKQVLVLGPSGCGKTSLIQKVAAQCQVPLVSIFGPEVCKPGPGDTERELRHLFRKSALLTQESGICILLIDEIDSVCPKRGSSTHMTRTTTQLLLLLEEVHQIPGLVVIATSSRPHAIDPAARRPGRLELEIYISVPSEQERFKIFQVLLQTTFQKNEDFTKLCMLAAHITPGYVGADISLVCHEALFNMVKQQEKSSDMDKVFPYFKTAIGKIRPSALKSGLGVVTTHCMKLSEIGGLENIKKTLRVSIEWPLLYPESFKRLGIPQPKGILLYGPPGCSKTSIARALASDAGTTFLSVSAAELYSPFFGDAEKNISELFHRARLGAPSILFIDEIDALVGNRGDNKNDHVVHERVLSTLLTEMDGVGLKVEALTSENYLQSQDSEREKDSERGNNSVIIVAATNRPDMLDDALLRPGRFDKLIYVPSPDVLSRLDILKIITRKMPLASDVQLEQIAKNTELFSGADIANLCKEAALCALTECGMDVMEVTSKDFQHALQIVKPSLNETQLRWYEDYKRK